MRPENGARERALAGLPVTDRQLDMGGISTAVLEGGTGTPIVLLHGPAANASHWMRVIPALATTHRVIAPDLPGQGATGPTVHGEPGEVLEWLGELVDRTCESPPVLVGVTLGGAIAARFAAEHGNRLDRLVLVDALGLAAFSPEPRFGLALNAFLARPDETTHDGLWRVCASDLYGMRGAMGESWESLRTYNLELLEAPETMAGLGALMQGFGVRAIPAEDLERIVVPTTLVWGRNDLATDVAVAQAASERYAWPLAVIEDCGDEPPIEQPEAFLATLEAAIGNRVEVAR